MPARHYDLHSDRSAPGFREAFTPNTRDYHVVNGEAAASAPDGLGLPPVGTFDLVEGDSGDNFLPGTGNADTIKGLGGNDTLYGLGGSDTIYGGDANDIAYGGLDVDTIYGGGGDDTLQGVEFGVVLTTTGPCDVIQGGSGTDTLIVNYAAFVNSGTGQPVNITMSMATGSGQVQVDGFQGENFSQMERLNFTGPEGNDTVTGGAFADTLDGRGGNDILRGAGGDDIIKDTWGTLDADGGDNNDTIWLTGTAFTHEYGNLTIHADAGQFLNNGVSMGSIVNFENLTIATYTGNDTIVGYAAGVNNISTGYNFGNKNFTGGDLNDTLSGGRGDDQLFGGGGNDTINTGYDGVKAAYGGAGDDTLNVASGSGWAYGGLGNDSLGSTGDSSGGINFDCGKGDDIVFQWSSLGDLAFTRTYLGGAGYDIIRVFVQSDDPITLDFTGAIIDNFEELQWVDLNQAKNINVVLTSAQFADFDVIRLGTENREDDFFKITLTDNAPVVLQEISQYMELQLADGGQSVDMSGVGTDWVPYVVGGNGDDTVIAPVFAAVDFFKAELMDGNDSFTGSNIRDEVFGGDGNDMIDGGGGNDIVHHTDDVLYGDGGNDHIDGGKRDDKLYGGDGKDNLAGGLGDDTIEGGKGADRVGGGDGLDVFTYSRVVDSRGKNFDTINGFDFDAQDRFNLKFAVTGIDATVASGTLSKASFDADMAASVDAAHLAAGHAVLFTPTAGGYAGKTFLVIESNGAAGYQAGADLVVTLNNAVHLASLDAADFT